jgi:hypothetical protein
VTVSWQGVDPTSGGALPWPAEELPESPAAHHTTELRWFARGQLPGRVRAWFTRPDAVTEARCDRYLVDQLVDVGIKIRGGQTLELKVRSDVRPWVDLGGGLGGRLEEWHKWSPADDVVDIPAYSRWISVDKVVSKRRFAATGTEIPMAGEPSGAGCDVEVTDVAVGSTQAWSFAFAAFGPPATRRAALHASWRALTTSGSVPAALVRELGWPMGYPQWLARRQAHEYQEIHR